MRSLARKEQPSKTNKTTEILGLNNSTTELKKTIKNFKSEICDLEYRILEIIWRSKKKKEFLKSKEGL